MASNTRNNGIIYLRALATAFIVACHLVNMSDITIVRFSGHFLDVGVQLFLIISGFLYGQREINSPYLTWIWKRMKKLLVPMYILVLSVIVGNLIIGQNIELKQVLSYAFNIQGLTEYYIKGASHLWYLSIAMICYMLTPLIQRYKEIIAKRLILIGGGYSFCRFWSRTCGLNDMLVI